MSHTPCARLGGYRQAVSNTRFAGDNSRPFPQGQGQLVDVLEDGGVRRQEASHLVDRVNDGRVVAATEQLADLR